MADTELNISPDEKVAGVPLARLLRNLDETSYNEGSDALACRLTDCKAVIEELLAARATPPSASTAPEVDERAAFEAWTTTHGGMSLDLVDDSLITDDGLALPTFKSGRTEIAWRAWHAALASRPAEVDDEGLPPLPYSDPELVKRYGPPTYTAEQYRQGQRDAVAADRARRGEIFQAQVENGNWCDIEESALPDWESMQIRTRRLLTAPSHTTNKEN